MVVVVVVMVMFIEKSIQHFIYQKTFMFISYLFLLCCAHAHAYGERERENIIGPAFHVSYVEYVAWG
jgi:hypothetical protein